MMRGWYEAFIGVRYLRSTSRKGRGVAGARGFPSLIAGIAMAGLAVGVSVLIVVLSVMNGFEEAGS